MSAAEFDRDPWALNVENGTVDLRTGELRPHRYEPNAECPQFMAFLYRIIDSHANASETDNMRAEELVLYLQKAFGCAATGKAEKLLFVLHGEGNNGKTTLLEVIRDVLVTKNMPVRCKLIA